MNMNWTLLLGKNTDIDGRGNRTHTDFDARLEKVQEARRNSSFDKKDGISETGKIKAFRIGSEIIVATAVGGGIGFSVDSWLNSKPWFLIVFLLLGNAAGLWNVFRFTRGYNYRVGFENDNIQKNNVDHETKKANN